MKNLDTNVDFSTSKSRPLTHEDGTKLNDYEIAKETLRCVDDYQAKEHKPSPLSPNFIEWLKEGIKFVDDKKGSFVDYKQRTIQKTLDYDLVIDNTNKQNAKLAKDGAFDSKVVQMIQGTSKEAK